MLPALGQQQTRDADENDKSRELRCFGLTKRQNLATLATLRRAQLVSSALVWSC